MLGLVQSIVRGQFGIHTWPGTGGGSARCARADGGTHAPRGHTTNLYSSERRSTPRRRCSRDCKETAEPNRRSSQRAVYELHELQRWSEQGDRGDNLQIQPVIPIHRNEDRNVTTRTLASLVWSPRFQPGSSVWVLGPAVVAIKSAGPIDAGVLVNNVFSPRDTTGRAAPGTAHFSSSLFLTTISVADGSSGPSLS